MFAYDRLTFFGSLDPYWVSQILSLSFFSFFSSGFQISYVITTDHIGECAAIRPFKSTGFMDGHSVFMRSTTSKNDLVDFSVLQNQTRYSTSLVICFQSTVSVGFWALSLSLHYFCYYFPRMICFCYCSWTVRKQSGLCRIPRSICNSCWNFH